MSTRSSLLTSVVTCALALCTAPASAQVTQTDAAKTPLPRPVGSAEMTLVTDSWGWRADSLSYNSPAGANLMGQSIQYGKFYSPMGGWPYGSTVYPQFVNGDAITLQGLFKWRGETLDPVKDAKTGPGYFSPACGFDGQLLLMGGNCNLQFGWYNVTDPNATTAPLASEIYPFIPAPLTALNCVQEDGKTPKTDGFCPLAWDNLNPRDLSIKRWTPKAFSSGNIKSDPNYKGGYVGFAVIGDPSKGCSVNKYSMYAFNQKNAQGTPWVTTLIYQSSVDPSGFYMAFEDLPMSTADWTLTGVPGAQGGCDGDFNDFVFFVSGLTCAGGNQPCSTGLQGACSVGRTDCAAEGETPVCRPIVQPSAEKCDNLDNDCNGITDDDPAAGPKLCSDPLKPICYQGTCVGDCSKGEFPCPGGTECDSTTGYCVKTGCVGISCPAGQVCSAGTCVDPCGPTTICPYGQICELGNCIDPCQGVTCPTGRVCEKGLCLADCSCRGCDAGLTCGADGRCTDPACVNFPCPAGQTCRSTNGVPACVNPCDGVVCPIGQSCSNDTGMCTVDPNAGTAGAGGSISVGGGFGMAGTFGVSGATGSGASAGTSGKGLKPANKAPGCACRAAGGDGERSSWAWLGLVAGIGALARRRRAA